MNIVKEIQPNQVQTLGDFRILFLIDFLEEIVYKLGFEKFKLVEMHGRTFQAEKVTWGQKVVAKVKVTSGTVNNPIC